MSKLTTDQVIVQFRSAHGSKYDYNQVEYVNDNKKVIITCLVEGHGDFTQSPNHHKRGKGCPKCNGKGLTLKEKQDIIGCDKLKLLKEFRKSYGNQGVKTTFVEYKCLEVGCEYIGTATWNDIKSGVGCGACSGRIITENNCLASKRPELIKYFLNQEESKNVTVFSNKKIQTICPNCKTQKNKLISVNILSKQPYSCSICGDGISIPEKFVGGVLRQLGINFKNKHTPKWANKKQYDFNFEINGESAICESHGIQHYVQSNRGRSLEEEEENDRLKERLAKENGIKYYIIIDCRYSDFKWLKENCTKALSPYYELISIDWDWIWESCQNSVKMEVWDSWNKRGKGDTPSTIAKKFNLDKTTVRKYLKIGTALGRCLYNKVIND